VVAAEKARAARLAKAEAAVKAHEQAVASKLAAWETIQSRDRQGAVEWVTLEPKAMKSSVQAKLTKLDDGSILVDGPNDRGNYTITADTDLTGITAIRLEAITDERLPRGGPGRAPDGNFVLNQLTVRAQSKKDATQAADIPLQKAQANFAQDNFAPAGAVDGTPNGAKGWAIAPHMGLTHWAVFETKEPAGFTGGSTLTFTFLHQFNQGKHSLGRFRLSVTRAKPPIALGLAETYRKILEVPTEKRDPKQQALLVRYFKAVDPESAKLQKELTEVRKPLPADPKLVELRNQLTELSKPLTEDGQLVQLRKDLEMSTKQLANKRLTAAQDIAWALINSPAFLFNR
jgi:hypothetical protein